MRLIAQTSILVREGKPRCVRQSLSCVGGTVRIPLPTHRPTASLSYEPYRMAACRDVGARVRLRPRVIGRSSARSAVARCASRPWVARMPLQLARRYLRLRLTPQCILGPTS
jgi:hypothetical protein